MNKKLVPSFTGNLRLGGILMAEKINDPYFTYPKFLPLLQVIKKV